MLALIVYLLQDFWRSHRYFMPTALYLIFVLWLYSVEPNPVMESYGVTVAVLFVIGIWFSRLLEGTEPDRQRELTVLHVGGYGRFALGRIAVLGLFGLGFSLFAVLVPMLKGAFDRQATFTELALALYGHELAFLLGAALGWAVLSRSGKLSAELGLSMLGAGLSLAAGGIEGMLPAGLGWSSWVLPPGYRIVELLMKFHALGAAARWFYLLYPLAYTAGLLFLAYRWMEVRRT